MDRSLRAACSLVALIVVGCSSDREERPRRSEPDPTAASVAPPKPAEPTSAEPSPQPGQPALPSPSTPASTTFSSWMRFMKDGTLLALRGTTLVRIDPDAGVLDLTELPEGRMEQGVVSGDERFLLAIVYTGGSSSQAYVADLETPSKARHFPVDDLQGGTIDHDGSRIALGGFIGLSVFDGKSGAKVCSSGETGIFNGVFAAGPIGSFRDVLLTTRVGAHAIVDPKTCAVLATDASNTGATAGSTVSPDGKWFATGADGGHQVELKSTTPMRSTRVLDTAGCPDHANPSWNRAASVLIDVGIDETRIAAYEPRSGRRISYWKLPANKLDAAAFEDGRSGAVLYGDRVEIVDAVAKKVRCTAPLRPKTEDSPGVVTSVDGSRAVVSLGGELTLVDAATCAARPLGGK